MATLCRTVAPKLLRISNLKFAKRISRHKSVGNLNWLLKKQFGPLLETKQQKLKRLKSVEKAADSNSLRETSAKDNKKELETENLSLALKGNETVKCPGFTSVTVKREVEIEPPKTENQENAKNSEDKTENSGPSVFAVKNSVCENGSNEIIRLSSRGTKKFSHLPSVTSILAASMSEESKKILEKWEKKMIEKHGLEGFKKYKNDLFQDGKYLHSAIESTLMQKPVQVHERVRPAFESVSDFLKNIEKVRAMESHVVHPTLKYRGYFDCIAFYKGELCLIDWKKSDKPKTSIMDTYDAPIQVASYTGAVNADENYPFQIKRGLVVVAYTNGNKAKVHEISGNLLEEFWKSWLERLNKYLSEAGN